MERRTVSTFVARAASACFAFAALSTCAPSPVFKLSSSDSANFTHNGSAYTARLDGGALVVTTTDGTSFTIDSDGHVTEMKAAGGAKFTLTYNGQNISVTPYIPEYDGNSSSHIIIKDVLPNAASKSSICDVISHGCEFLSNFVDNVLPSVESKIADRYAQKQGLPREAVEFIVHGYIVDITNKVKNFCAGWGLLILVNQNPCDDFAGQACPSVHGTWNLTYNGVPGHRMSVEANGADATAALEVTVPDTSASFVVDLTGTLSVGTNSCAECIVFEGTWSSNLTSLEDHLQTNIQTPCLGCPSTFVPPNRPFSIVFDGDRRSAQGKLSEDGAADITLSAERSDCN